MKSRTRQPEHVACIGEIRNAYKISVRKSQGKRTRCRWEEHIRIHFMEIRLKMVQNRVQ
jgi:hypothetical protein